MSMKKISDFAKEHKSEIIISLVTTAFVTLLFNFLMFLTDVSPKWVPSVVQSVINIIYAFAAYKSSANIIANIDMIIGFVNIVIWFSCLSEMRQYNKELRNEIGRIERTSDEGHHVSDNNEELISAIKQMEGEMHNLTVSLKKSLTKNSRRVFFVTIVCISVSSLLLISSIIPSNIWQKFERDITMIAPYTEAQNITQLRSDWTRMQSKDDYNRIYEFISQVKEENSLSK